MQMQMAAGAPGEGNGTPLQYSCLENPMDRGAWWAAVHGVTKSRTRLSAFTFPSLSCSGEGSGNPLQCSCLENPRDGEAWWAAIYGVSQSRTRLKRLSSSHSPQPSWAPCGGVGGLISAVPLRVPWEEPHSGGSDRLSRSLVSWPRQDRKPGRSLSAGHSPGAGRDSTHGSPGPRWF